MSTRLLLRFITLGLLAGLGSCSRSWSFIIANESGVDASLTYRLRPDTADACAQCRLGFSLSTPTWITRDSAGYRWIRADSMEYRATPDGRDILFELTIPPGGIVQIYRHTGLDEYTRIPFRLVELDVAADTQRVTAAGEIVRGLFKKRAYYGYVFVIPARAAA